MTRLNPLAIFFLLGSAPLGLLLQRWLAPDNEAVAVLIAASLMTLLDLGYRLRQKNLDGKSRWLARQAGAFLAFFPLWGWGLVLGGIALVQLTTGKAIF